jgi:hypothetical protein
MTATGLAWLLVAAERRLADLAGNDCGQESPITCSDSIGRPERHGGFHARRLE